MGLEVASLVQEGGKCGREWTNLKPIRSRRRAGGSERHTHNNCEERSTNHDEKPREENLARWRKWSRSVRSQVGLGWLEVHGGDGEVWHKVGVESGFG